MAKIMKITDDITNDIIEKFKEYIRKANIINKEIKFSYPTEKKINKRAKIIFTPEAYLKMISLITEYSTEIAWHGVVEKIEIGTYRIKDILVYPQKVSGVNVITDQKQYEKWLIDIDDETFKKIRMQGHSHVNMGVLPSSTDINDRIEIIKQIEDNDFYIFMIWNKNFSHHCEIYDAEENTIYQNYDIGIYVKDDTCNLFKFLEDTKKYVVNKTNYEYIKTISNKTEKSKNEEKRLTIGEMKAPYNFLRK